jgi:LmbE family N-acetylglucosaminyl deacetylase
MCCKKNGAIVFERWIYKINSDFYDTLSIMQIPQASKVLVIAPHNDDEMLSCSILIKRLVDQGSDVSFAIITNGDGFTPDIIISSKKLAIVGSDYIRLGMIRQRETLNGLALLGIPADNIRFFGYPDRGCQEMLLFNWYSKAPYFDPWTKSNIVPYQNSFGDMPALAGENMLKDIKTVLKEVAPNLIIMPHPYDENVDHAAINAMIPSSATSERA